MKKTRIFLIIFLVLTLSLALFFPNQVYAAGTGFVGIILDFGNVIIEIDSPLNVTYNFGIGTNYTLELNVSSQQLVDTFRYTLEDLRHGVIVYQDIVFTPNITFDAVRWDNKLTVYGNVTSSGKEGFKEVYFHVNVPESAPVIADLVNNSFACESSPALIYINVTDLDENSLNYILSPSNPIFPFEYETIGYFTKVYYLNSLNLLKNYAGQHFYNFSVSDGIYSDSRVFNITVIAINNIPEVENLSAVTLYTKGENSTFNETWDVFDIENGLMSTGNFSVNISFSGTHLFNITNDGNMTFQANATFTGVHNVSVCLSDSAISYIHPNITYCGNTGLNNSVCDFFSITVTDENRVPRVENQYPVNTSFITDGNQDIYFNITTFDPDETIPDVYWYFDGQLTEYDELSSFNEFFYNYPCGQYGSHTVDALISDGISNSTFQWNFTVLSVACPIFSGGGGGGGGGGKICTPSLGCDLWSECRSIELDFSQNIISSLDYIEIKRNCTLIGLSGDSCGYQYRACTDVALCVRKILPQKSFCQFISNPSCEDNVKNCHDGACEVLTDCSGPCDACTTCSDGIQNQGEKGIDCSGPCPNICTIDNPLVQKEELKYVIYIILAILLLLLITLIVINIVRVVRIKREIGELNWYELLKVKGSR